jgi:transcriptional regulator with XRE-family HTH domain
MAPAVSDQSDPDLVAARHRLGSELRRLRESAKVSGTGLAAELGWSQAKISRIETARTLVSVDDVAALLDRLNPSRDVRSSILALAEHAAQGSWRNSTGFGLSRRQQDFIDFERASTNVRHYNPVLLPGYMQSEAYARRVIEIAGASNEERALEYRLARRSTMLMEGGPTYRIVLMETCVRWRPFSAAEMIEQLALLAGFSQRGNVELRIIPLDQRQSTYVQHPFMIFDLGTATSPQALIETTVQDYRLSDDATVDKLSYYFDELSSSAMSPSASLALIRKVGRDLADDR